ncbi:hypothetical protein Hamer_G016689 [Homarus americanus]|uniref:Uncharacterized protein n=1 Tax=Homarus americanus TaxID=6706 RepID=A0A8J5NCU7_HOMAM|nr:hypothetical protein Hamer_G016689 [Homarus americanus]
MGQDGRAFVAPLAALLTVVFILAVAFCDNYNRHYKSYQPKDTESLDQDLTFLMARIKELEAKSTQTGRQLRFLKKLLTKMEERQQEKTVLQDMCGVFVPCEQDTAIQPTPTVTPVAMLLP